MSKIILLFSLCLLFTGVGQLRAAPVSNYPPLTEQQKQAFYSQIEDQITLSQQKLTELVNEMANPDTLVSPALKIEIKRVAEIAKVKEILGSEFIGKESVRSPLVRNALLNVMSKDDIQPQDLERLQRVVDSEKVNIAAYDARQAEQIKEVEKAKILQPMGK